MNEPFEVWGSGFQPGEPVALVLKIDGSLQPVLGGQRGAQTTADAAGNFRVSFNAIGGVASTRERAPGARAIEAQGADGSRASTPVVIVTGAAATAAMPSLFANGTSSGGDTLITGAGFRANELVSVSVVGVSEGEDLILVGQQANEFGAFQVSAAVNLQPGIYTLRAAGDGGSEATAALVVTGPK